MITRSNSAPNKPRLWRRPPAGTARDVGRRFLFYITEGFFIANPVVVLIAGAVISLVLWGTINFAFGGKAKFGSIFTVWMFAGLPGIIKVLLGVIVIFAGVAPESFNIKKLCAYKCGGVS